MQETGTHEEGNKARKKPRNLTAKDRVDESLSSIDSPSIVTPRKTGNFGYDVRKKSSRKIKKHLSMKYEHKHSDSESSSVYDPAIILPLPLANQSSRSRQNSSRRGPIEPNISEKDDSKELSDEPKAENSEINDVVRDEEIKIPVENPNLAARRSGLMASSKSSSFSNLIQVVKNTQHVDRSQWEPLSSSQKFQRWFCKCFHKSEDLPLATEQMVFKLIVVSNQSIKLENDVHTNILFNYFQRKTGEVFFENNPETWEKMGFSSADTNINGILQPGVIISLLFLIFLIEKKKELFEKIYNYSKSIKLGVVKVSNMLVNESLALLRGKKINGLFDSDEDVVLRFFEFHGGVVMYWIEVVRLGLEQSIVQAIRKSEKSPNECRLRFIGA